MKLTLEQLETLDAIARRGSFSAAADELHRVPSAVTYTVKQLEDRVGSAIFDRSGHRARLTPVGEFLLREGRRLLHAAADLERRAHRLVSGWEAEFRIAVSDLIALEDLWPLAAAFHAEAGDTRLTFRREVFGGSWDALLDGRADLVIGAPGDGPAGGGYRTRRLGEIAWCFAVAPDHPLAATQGVVSSDELERVRVVAAEDSSRNLPPRQAGVRGGQDVLNVPDLDAKLSAQRAGLGGGFLPRRIAEACVRADELVILEVEEQKEATPLWLAWPASGEGRALDWWLAALRNWSAAGFEGEHG